MNSFEIEKEKIFFHRDMDNPLRVFSQIHKWMFYKVRSVFFIFYFLFFKFIYLFLLRNKHTQERGKMILTQS